MVLRLIPQTILTIEDPVEFVHESQKSLIRPREVGLNTLKFHHALRAALREDPDAILAGKSEIRRPSQQHLKQLKPVTWVRDAAHQLSGQNRGEGAGDVCT